LFKKILSYGFVEGISKGINKLTILILPFLIDVSSYGQLALLISVELVLPAISFLGLDRAILRFYSIKKEYRLFDNTVSFSVKLSHLVILSLLVIIYLIFGNNFFGIKLFPDLLLVIFLVFFQGMNLLKFNMLRVNEDHVTYFKTKLIFNILKFLLVLLIVLVFKSYLGYLFGSLISSILIYSSFKNKISLNLKNKGSLKTFKTLFTFSYPFVFHGISLSLLGNADKFIMNYYLSSEEVGVYTLAYVIGSSISFSFIGITVFMEPLIYKEKNLFKRKIVLNKFRYLTMFIGVVSYFIICLCNQYLFPNIYNDSYNDMLIYIPLIALAYLVFPYYLKANYILTYNKETKFIALISIFSSLLNIILNIILIPLYGIYAAVMLTIFSFMLQSIIFTIISNREKMLNKELFSLLMFIIILVISVYFKTPYYILTVLCLLFIAFDSKIFLKFKNMPQ
jgi:O-antigen/teichoic acid export membrane protein